MNLDFCFYSHTK